MRRGLSRRKLGADSVRRVPPPRSFPGRVVVPTPGGRRLPHVHGVIFASFSDFLTARFGSETAAAILEGEPVYLLSETYEDERLLGLVGQAAKEVGMEEADLVHAFGVFTGERTFTRLYPAYYSVAGGTRAFLLSVETLIHELVRATIPNARPPELRVLPQGEDGVRITYTSPRKLDVLLRGLVEGTANHYGERAALEEPECMHRGDPACVFDVTVSRG